MQTNRKPKDAPNVDQGSTRGIRLLPIRVGRPSPFGLQWSERAWDADKARDRRKVITLATNDNWGAAANAADVPTASAQVGAFALPAGSKDAVLLVSLEPGAYTAQVTGSGPAGDALVEVYEIK